MKRLLQLCVLRLGLLQDGDVGVGVFPEPKETVTRASACVLTGRYSAGQNGRAQKNLRSLCIPYSRTSPRRRSPATRRFGRGLPSTHTLALYCRERHTLVATHFSIAQSKQRKPLLAAPSG